jgi:hypothetical protein
MGKHCDETPSLQTGLLGSFAWASLTILEMSSESKEIAG